MSLQHAPHFSRHHGSVFRGTHRTRPAPREAQKPPQPDTTNHIRMPDGGLVSPADFHTMRSNSHKGLRGDLVGCAKQVLSYATPGQRKTLEAWMRQHRTRRIAVDAANDHVMAVLLDYAGSRMKNPLNAFSVYALINEAETLHSIIPTS